MSSWILQVKVFGGVRILLIFLILYKLDDEVILVIEGCSHHDGAGNQRLRCSDFWWKGVKPHHHLFYQFNNHVAGGGV